MKKVGLILALHFHYFTNRKVLGLKEGEQFRVSSVSSFQSICLTLALVVNPVQSLATNTLVRTMDVFALHGIITFKRPFQTLVNICHKV